jgi:glucokinase
VSGDADALLLRMVGGDPDKITAATVYEAAKRGDDAALDVVRETSRFLGAGIANLLNIFNPEVVVIAGGVTQAGDTLFVPLRREVRKRAFKPAVDACVIVPGTLTAAGVVGAVAAYKQQDEV